ncbi:hypothetical protein KCP74_17610 [Salmonella enterica subsp. enterica]|nr:hypothetical protein KCP74_17610 [Salmonella enterica subsp. enterica]
MKCRSRKFCSIHISEFRTLVPGDSSPELIACRRIFPRWREIAILRKTYDPFPEQLRRRRQYTAIRKDGTAVGLLIQTAASMDEMAASTKNNAIIPGRRRAYRRLCNPTCARKGV